MFDYQKKLKQLPYSYIPVSECKAWETELAGRPQRQRAEEANGDGDFDGAFLDKDPKDKKDKSVVYEHEEVTPEKIKALVHAVAEEAISLLLPKKLAKMRDDKQEAKNMAKLRAASERKK